MKACFKIFVLSDIKEKSLGLNELLSEYDQYELHYIPTDINLFDVLKYEPDVVVLDREAEKVVKCHEWNVAA